MGLAKTVAGILIMFSAAGAWAQQDVNNPYVGTSSTLFIDRGMDTFAFLDTSLEKHHLFNPLFRNSTGFQDLGNIASPSRGLRFTPHTRNGFDLGWHYMDAFSFLPAENATLYRTRKPLTRLYYVQGPKEMINLSILHSQNILPNWNVGIEYNRLKSDGFYLNQPTSIYNTRLFNWYHTKDQRYHLVANVLVNSIDNQENGGLLSAASFDTIGPGVRQAAVRFYEPGRGVEVRNKQRNADYRVKQYFRFGPQDFLATAIADTLGNPLLDTNKTRIATSQVSVETGYSRYRNIFQLNDSAVRYFPGAYLDSAGTYDSLLMREFFAEAMFQTGLYKRELDRGKLQQRRFFLEAGARYSALSIGRLADDAFYNNFSVRGKAGTHPATVHRFRAEVSGYLGLRGYNQGDFELRATAEKELFKKFAAGAVFSTSSFSPSFTSNFFFNNHYFWDQQLSKTQQQELGFSLRTLALRHNALLEVHTFSMQNLVYFNAAARPDQVSGNRTILQARFRKTFQVGKFYLENDITYQAGSIDSELRLPAWVTYHSLYYQGALFKNALLAKIGVDIFYNSEFRGLAWNPAIRQFHLQNQYMIGNYPWVNIFVTARIKTFTLFVMFQHANMDLSGSYYSSPLYPKEPRAIRLGIQWKFYD